MNQYERDKWLTRNRPREEAEHFAQTVGLHYEYVYESWGSRLTGNYLGRLVSIELTLPIVGRSHYNYRIKCTTKLSISIPFQFHAKEKSLFYQFFRGRIPIAQQNGTNLVHAQYKMSGQPAPFVDKLLQSPDFCYSTLLLSPLVVDVNDNLFCCECKGLHPYSYEIPLVLERFYTLASAIESTLLTDL